MYVLLHDKFIVETELDVRDVRAALKINTHKGYYRSLFSFYREAGMPYFSGDINEFEFKISPIMHYRNIFLPIVIGKLKKKENGCIVHIVMRPCIQFVLLPLMIGLMFGKHFFSLIIEWHNVTSLFIVPIIFIMMVGVYLLYADSCKTKLMRILNLRVAK